MKVRVIYGRGPALFAQAHVTQGRRTVARSGSGRDGVCSFNLPNGQYQYHVRWRGLKDSGPLNVTNGPAQKTVRLHGEPHGLISPGPRRNND